MFSLPENLGRKTGDNVWKNIQILGYGKCLTMVLHDKWRHAKFELDYFVQFLFSLCHKVVDSPTLLLFMRL